MNYPLILEKIKEVSPSIISCCDYHRSYLMRLQKDAGYYLHFYRQLLIFAEKQLNEKSKEQAVIWDFGCGQGLLGATASLSGWGKIGLIDMNEHCVENARKIKDYLKLNEIYLEVGDENFLQQLALKTGSPDVIVSTDVIEHVYEIGTFLSRMKLAAPKASLIITTGAIAENPLRARPMIRLQVADEYHVTDELQTTEGNPYAGQPFLKVRYSIIEDFDTANQIDKKDKEELAKLTRGMNKADIQKATQQFLQNQGFPELLKHPTNTCDPISSSWTERLMTKEEYTEQFRQSGYEVSFHSGYYNDVTSKGLKKTVLKMMNIFLKLFPLPQYSAALIMVATPM